MGAEPAYLGRQEKSSGSPIRESFFSMKIRIPVQIKDFGPTVVNNPSTGQLW